MSPRSFTPLKLTGPDPERMVLYLNDWAEKLRHDLDASVVYADTLPRVISVLHTLEGGLAGSVVLRSRVDNDPNYRWRLLADGKTEWGDGTNAPDVNLYRSTGRLKTDDIMEIVDRLHVGSSYTAPPSGGIRVEGDSVFEAAVSMGALTASGLITGQAGLILDTARNPRAEIRYDFANAQALWFVNSGVGGKTWSIGDGIGTSAGRFGFYNVTDVALRLSLGSGDLSPASAGGLTLGTTDLPWGHVIIAGAQAYRSKNTAGTVVDLALIFADIAYIGSGGGSIPTQLRANGVDVIRLTTTGEALVGTSTAATGSPRLDVVGTGGATALLAIADSITNAVNKGGGVVVRHYTNSEEPASVIHGRTETNANLVRIGGGNGSINAATAIEFYTAANTTTLTGTLGLDLTGVGPDAVLGLRGAAAYYQKAGDPSTITNAAHVYAKDVSGTAEIFVRDEGGTATQISPHDPRTGEWYLFSHNQRQGWAKRFRMERFLEDVMRTLNLRRQDYIEEFPALLAA